MKKQHKLINLCKFVEKIEDEIVELDKELEACITEDAQAQDAVLKKIRNLKRKTNTLSELIDGNLIIPSLVVQYDFTELEAQKIYTDLLCSLPDGEIIDLIEKYDIVQLVQFWEETFKDLYGENNG